LEEKIMSDPSLDDNLERERRYRLASAQRPADTASMGWLVAAVVALLVLAGMAIYGMSDRSTTASNPPAETTGRVDRAPASPLPANPNATEPQREAPRAQ
jgi:hypothetical protein